MIQVWRCKKCGASYESPVRIKSITCSKGHKPTDMEVRPNA